MSSVSSSVDVHAAQRRPAVAVITRGKASLTQPNNELKCSSSKVQ